MRKENELHEERPEDHRADEEQDRGGKEPAAPIVDEFENASVVLLKEAQMATGAEARAVRPMCPAFLHVFDVCGENEHGLRPGREQRHRDDRGKRPNEAPHDPAQEHGGRQGGNRRQHRPRHRKHHFRCSRYHRFANWCAGLDVSVHVLGNHDGIVDQHAENHNETEHR